MNPNIPISIFLPPAHLDATLFSHVHILVTNDKMSDADAYSIVKLIVDKKDDLVAVHKDAASFSVENQIKANSPIPWQPGAVKFFVEKGAKM